MRSGRDLMKIALLLVAGIAGVSVVWYWWTRYQQQQLARIRSGQGFEEFAAYFPTENYPRDRLHEVYTYLQKLQFIKNFPVDPNDDLDKVYGLWDEDLDDAVSELAEQWRKKPPAEVDLEGYPPVRTVADLVRLLSRLPPRQ